MIPALSSSSRNRSVYTALGTCRFDRLQRRHHHCHYVVFFGGLAGNRLRKPGRLVGFGAVIAPRHRHLPGVAFGTRRKKRPRDRATSPACRPSRPSGATTAPVVSTSYVLYSIANLRPRARLPRSCCLLPASYSVVGIIAFVIGLAPCTDYQPPRAAPLHYLGGMALMVIATSCCHSSPISGRLHRAGALLPARPCVKLRSLRSWIRLVRTAQRPERNEARYPLGATHAG